MGTGAGVLRSWSSRGHSLRRFRRLAAGVGPAVLRPAWKMRLVPLTFVRISASVTVPEIFTHAG